MGPSGGLLLGIALEWVGARRTPLGDQKVPGGAYLLPPAAPVAQGANSYGGRSSWEEGSAGFTMVPSRFQTGGCQVVLASP